MDGPQNANQGFAGFQEIPGKDEPETQAWPPGESWQGQLTAIYALQTLPNKDGSVVNIDMLRWGRELLSPRDYTNSTYYQLWLYTTSYTLGHAGRGGLTLDDFIKAGIVSKEQMAAATKIHDTGMTEPVPGFSKPNAAGEFTSTTYQPGVPAKPKYAVGQKMRAVLQASAGHTREYAYLRGRTGVVDKIYPVAKPGAADASGKYTGPYPDISSRGKQEYLIPIYSVRFKAEDLWGKDYVEPNTVVYIDMWEPYVEPAA